MASRPESQQANGNFPPEVIARIQAGADRNIRRFGLLDDERSVA